MSLEELSGSDKTNIQPPASTDDPDKKHWLEFPGVSVAPTETQPAPAVDPFAAFRLGSSPTLSRTTNDTIPTLPASQPAAGPLLGPGGAFNFGNLSVDKSKDFSGNLYTNSVVEVKGADGSSTRYMITKEQKDGPVLASDSVGYTRLDAYGQLTRGTTFATGLTEMRPEVIKALDAMAAVQRRDNTAAVVTQVSFIPTDRGLPTVAASDTFRPNSGPAAKTVVDQFMPATEVKPAASKTVDTAVATTVEPKLADTSRSVDPIKTVAAALPDEVSRTNASLPVNIVAPSDSGRQPASAAFKPSETDTGSMVASGAIAAPLTSATRQVSPDSASSPLDVGRNVASLFAKTAGGLPTGVASLPLLGTSDVRPYYDGSQRPNADTQGKVLGTETFNALTRQSANQSAINLGNAATSTAITSLDKSRSAASYVSGVSNVNSWGREAQDAILGRPSSAIQTNVVLPDAKTNAIVPGRPAVDLQGKPVPAYSSALYDQARGYSQPEAGARNLGDAAVRTPEARAAFSTGAGDNVGGITKTATAAITKTISNNGNETSYIGRPKQPTDGKTSDTTAGGRPLPAIQDSQNGSRQPARATTTSKDVLSPSVGGPKVPVLPSQIARPDQVIKPAVVTTQGKAIADAVSRNVTPATTRVAEGDSTRGPIRKSDDSKIAPAAKLPAAQRTEVRTDAGPAVTAAKAALDKGAGAFTVSGKPTERTAASPSTKGVEGSRTLIIANKGDQVPTRARLDSSKEAKPGSDSQHMLAAKPVKPAEIATASTRLLGTISTKLPPEKVAGNGTLGVYPTRTTRAADIAAAKVQPGKTDAAKIEVVKVGDAKSGGIRVTGASDKPVITISRTLGGEKVAGEGKGGGTKLVGAEAKIAGGKSVPVVGAADKGIAGIKGGVVADKGVAGIKGGVVADKGVAGIKGGVVTDKGVATEKGADRSIGGRLVPSKSGNGVSTLVEGKTITGTRPAASRLDGRSEVKIDGKAIAHATRTVGGKGVAADAAKFVVGDKKTEGKSVSAIKVGNGKLNVSDAEAKAIIGSRFGHSKLVTTDKIDIKAISGAKIGATGKLTLTESEIKALAGGRLGVKITGSVKCDAKGAPIATGADAKLSSASTAKSGSGKVVISDAAVKAITAPKSISSAKQLAGEKTDAKAITTGKGSKAIIADTSSKPVSKAELIAGPGGVKGAKSSVGDSVIAEKSNLVKTQPNNLVKTGTDRVDTASPKAARPLDAVAKIFGMALGADKTDKSSLRDRDGKTDGKDKAVRTDEHVARRIVGNGIQSTEPKNGQRTEGNRDDVDTIKKDAKNNDRVAGSTTRNNQQVSDKLQNWMMQIAEAGLNFGDRRPAKVSQSQKSQNLFKTAGRRRRRYTVRYGDNIRSIARVQLGDERFAQLIITINRGSAGFYMLPDNKTPHLLVDQVIWLPSDAELEIHKKHFFARGTAAGEQQIAPAISVAPEAITVPQVEMEKVTLPEVEIMQGDNTEAYAPPTTVSYEQNQQEVASFLQRLRSAGHRQAVSLQNFEEGGQFDTTEPPQQGDRRVYRVRLGDTLRSIALRDALMQDQTMWPLLARVNGLSEQRDATTGHPTVSLSRGETVNLPTEEEIKQYRLMNRLVSAANNATLCTAETNLLATESQSNEPKPSIETLSQSCRINSIESESHDAYMTRLEMYINGQWMTVATYDYRHGHAYRYIHRKNGSVAAFPMDLPLEVVRQMSHEDFARNWTTYCIDFATVSPDAVSRSS